MSEGTNAPQFDVIDAKYVLKRLNLESVVMGDYLVLMRSDFDATIEEEMYIALLLVYNVKSGGYVARVWNETLTVGKVLTLEDFMQACKNHFDFNPCVGIPGDSEELTFLPSTRKFSKSCLRLLKDNDASTCQECLSIVTSSSAECKVELSIEPDQDVGFTAKVEKSDIEDADQEADLDYKEDLDQAFSDAVYDSSLLLSKGDLKNEKLSSDAYDSDYVADDCSDSDYNNDDGQKNVEDESKVKIKRQTSRRKKRKYSSDEEDNDSDDAYQDDKRIRRNARHKEYKKRQKEKMKNGPLTEEQSTTVVCPWCKPKTRGRPLKKGQRFELHKKTVHFWGEFRCTDCPFIGNFASELVEHARVLSHMQNDSAHCPNCDRSICMLDIETHYKDCVVKHVLVKCEMCDFGNRKFATVYRHMKIKHFWGLFYCADCTFLAHYAKEIADHTRQFGHKKEIQCPTTNCEVFMSADEIGLHYEKCIIKHLKKNKHECNMKHAGPPRLCEMCGKSFKAKGYVKHILVCKGKSEDKRKRKIPDITEACCEICGKKYVGPNARSQVTNHKKWAHDKIYECPMCEYRCGLETRLEEHMRIHKEPEFKCSICGKGLKTRKTLIAHEMDHTGHRPFSCEVCGKGFTCRGNLHQHKRLVHKIAGPLAKPSRREREKGITGFHLDNAYTAKRDLANLGDGD